MRIGVFALGLGLVSGLCPPVSAADQLGEDVPFSDLYLAFTMPPSPKVTERATAGNGDQTTYRWRDPGQSFGYGLEVSSINGVGHPWGGVVWGFALSATDYDITPGYYGVDGGGNFLNNSPDSLHYRTIGLTALGGYEYGINGDDGPGEGISSFLMILPLVTFGPAWTDDEQQSSAGTYTRERYTGSFYEIGLRIGGYLTEQDWIYGIMLEGLIGRAKAHFNFPGNTSSDLILKTQGVGFGLIAGYRF